MSDAHVPVEVSEWQQAPFALGDETVFAIGDIHGCAKELRALLSTIAAKAAKASHPTRLIYLGDMIDRGARNIEVLDLWAEPAAARGVDRIDRIMGNHEQLLLLAITGGPHARKAETMWLGERMGGTLLLEEMRAKVGDQDARLDTVLLESALGDDVFGHLRSMLAHVTIGNTLFVHGGVDPLIDTDELLSRPWTAFMEARWAWIQEGFLDWRSGYGGRLIVHGHTPPTKHKAISGQEDPHLFMYDRLGLDGGTTVLGFVTGAEIENGRYRILRAGTPVAA